MFIIVFIGQYTDKKKAQGMHGVSVAGNNFQWKIVDSGRFDKTLSILPIYYKFKNYALSEKRSYKYLLKFLYLFYVIFKSIKLVKNLKGDIVFYNNSFVYFLLFGMARLKGLKVYLILADSEKNVSSGFVDKILSKYDGVLSLNYLESSTQTKKVQVIPGITVVNTNIYNPAEYSANVVFSGSLNKYSGIERALKVFSLIPSVELRITGKGPLEKLVRKFSLEYENIKYYGFLKKTDYEKLLKETCLAISFRCEGVEENEYNFPSKIVEYASFGVPVLSTMQYKHIPERTLIDEIPLNDLALANFICELLEDRRKLSFFGKKSYDFFKEKCSIDEFFLKLDMLREEQF